MALSRNRTDQEMSLCHLLKENYKVSNEDQLKETSKAVLDFMSSSLSDEDGKFSGIPQISICMQDFLTQTINSVSKLPGANFENFLENFKKVFHLSELSEFLIDQCVEAYLQRNISADPEKLSKNKILVGFENLAVQHILKANDHQEQLPTNHLEKLREEELEVLLELGLLHRENEVEEFLHPMFQNLTFSNYLKTNFNNEECSKFIVNHVLQDECYQQVRSMINHWISEKINQDTLQVYRTKLLATADANKTPLYIAGFEGLEDLFYFIYSSLTKTQQFAEDKQEVQEYLNKIAKWDYTALVQYFDKCDDTYNILEEIKSDFGIEFIKEIFTLRMYNKGRLLHNNSDSDKNFLKILKFVCLNFQNDPKFLMELFLLKEWHDKDILCLAFECLRNENLIKILEEMESLKSVVGIEFINELFLVGVKNSTFISKYVGNNNFDYDIFIEILEKVKSLCDEATMKKILLAYNTNYCCSILQWCCRQHENFNLIGMIQWLNGNYGTNFVKDLLVLQNYLGNTLSSFLASGSAASFFVLVKFLKNELHFENEFIIDEILFSENIWRETPFWILFAEPRLEQEFFDNLFEFLATDLQLSEERLFTYLNKTQFIYFIAQSKNSEDNGILKILEQKFGKNFVSQLYSNELLQDVFKRYMNVPCWQFNSYRINAILKYLNFILDQHDLSFLKNHISGKNSEAQTILFHLESDLHLVRLLVWLLEKFANEKTFLENFLLEVDENGDSFLMFMIKKLREDSGEFCFSLGELADFLIENFDKEFKQRLLLVRNNENQTFLNIIMQKDSEANMKILDELWEKSENDKEFMEKLIDEELRKENLIAEWIEAKLSQN